MTRESSAGAALDELLGHTDPTWAPAIRELDAAIRAAAPELTAFHSYRMLMYSLGEHRRAWVVAIGTSSRVLTVRFLYGVLLDDPDGVFRGGTSTLTNIDFDSPADVDAELVAGFVRQAVPRFSDFLQQAT